MVTFTEGYLLALSDVERQLRTPLSKWNMTRWLSAAQTEASEQLQMWLKKLEE